MTEQAHSAASARHRFLHAVQRELTEFEQREREFSKADRQERAAQLAIQAALAKARIAIK